MKLCKLTLFAQMGLKKIPFGSALYVADKCDQIIEKIPLFL
jgi:hypothetical protein